MAYDVQKGRTGVFEKMPSVGDLDGLGNAFRRHLTITTAAVAADGLDPRMVFEPGRHRPDVSVVQQVDDLAPFEIADDRAVAMPAPPGKVIEADDIRGRGRGGRTPPQSAKQGIGTHRHRQALGQTFPGAAAKDDTDAMNKTIEAAGAAASSRDDVGGEPFDEGLPIAGGDRATKTARSSG